MNRRSQSGISLIEVAVAGAILAIAAGGALLAISAAGKYASQQDGPARSAALVVAQQTLRVAQNAWKYGSPGGAPAGTQIVTLPFSTQTSAPATISTTIAANGTGAQITVTVRYTPEPGRAGDPGIVTLSGQVAQRSPLPGSRVQKPGLVPAPSGAP